MNRSRLRNVFAGLVLVAATACGGGGDSGGSASNTPAPAPAPPPAAPAAAQPAPGTAVADGRAVYTRVCQACHQANGQGLAPTWPPLAGSEWVNGEPNRVIRIVLHGLQGPITVKRQPYNSVMAPWKSLPDAEIAAVISYVRSSFGNTSAVVTPQDVARERAATASRTAMYTVGELGR